MSEDFKIAEVIAKLDIYERDLRAMADRARGLRVELFNSLDSQQPDVVD